MSVESFISVARAYDGVEDSGSSIRFGGSIKREQVLLGTTLPAVLGHFPAAASCDLVGVWRVHEPGGKAYHVVHSNTNKGSGPTIGRAPETQARTYDGGIALSGVFECWNVSIEPEGVARLGQLILRPCIEVDGLLVAADLQNAISTLDGRVLKTVS